MLTHQQLLTCPTCTFLNDPSRSWCEICSSSLKTNEQGLQPESSNEKAKAKTRPKNPIQSAIFLLLALSFGILGVVKVFPSHLTTSSLFSQDALNENGDIQLYDTMKEVPNVPGGIVNYGGAICFAALQREGMNTAIKNAYPQFQLRYVEPILSNPGCTTGIQMLLDRDLTIAQNSRPLTEAETRCCRTKRI